jgi:predicted AlkP superfamily pyrophosphatase or phosphodiesterase
MLDDYVDLDAVQVDFDGPVVGLRPLDGQVEQVIARLSRLPAQFKVYRESELPARWHLRGNPRIPPVWIVADPGWRIQRKSTFLVTKDYLLKGDHGYDSAVKEMQGIFIANGPSFRSGVVVDAVENIHLYNLFCAAIGLTPAPNDGDDRLVRSALTH